MEAFASTLRKAAEQEIVLAFRSALEGRGNGPTEANLRVFARLVAFETRMQEGRCAPMPGERAIALLPDATARSAVAPLNALPGRRRVIAVRSPFANALLAALLILGALTLLMRASVAPPALQALATGVASQDSPARTESSAAAPPLRADANAAAPAVTVPATTAALHDVPTPAAREIRASPQRGSTAAGARPANASAQLGRCAAQNFFSRAICQNAVCAQNALAHAPACASVLHQRRVDEARRNPVLAG
jgi:hypothetical protein